MNTSKQDNNPHDVMVNALERAGKRFLNKPTEYDAQGHKCPKPIPAKPPKANRGNGNSDYKSIIKSFNPKQLDVALTTEKQFHAIMKDLEGHLLNRKGLSMSFHGEDLVIIRSEKYMGRKTIIISYEFKDITIRKTHRSGSKEISTVDLNGNNIMQHLGLLDVAHDRIVD